jgi:hypothetical protein
VYRKCWCGVIAVMNAPVLATPTARADDEREFVTGNEIPRMVAHRCIIEASIGKRIVQT